MKALVIGAAGFVGGYLVQHLRDVCGWTVYATKLPSEEFEESDVRVYDLDMLNKDAVRVILKEIQPDYIFYLAAQSSVAVSWKKPELTVDINIKGCVHLLESARELEKKPRILLIGSSEEYGPVKVEKNPVSEETVINPRNIYAVTKATQNMLGKLYADAYDMDIIMVRAFNHIGPKQEPIFVVADFCRQVALIEAKKQEPVISVGNLAAKRDFTDVRDIVRAYALLVQMGKAGEIYNIGSGKAIAISDILNLIISNTIENIEVKIDKNRYRPVDVPIIEADISKLKKDVEWEKEISFQQTILDTLEYWRDIIRKND